jgi:CRISPR-associated protein Csy2
MTAHLKGLVKTQPLNEDYLQLLDVWNQHCQLPYQEDNLPDKLKNYFDSLQPSKDNKALLIQWQNYCSPTERTDVDWEYIRKPKTGYLVPIMTGYKAISEVHENEKVASTRDNQTPVCFVESVHSIGEWWAVHHLKTLEDLKKSLWHYHYEEHWYLCKQYQTDEKTSETHNDIVYENPEDDIN